MSCSPFNLRPRSRRKLAALGLACCCLSGCAAAQRPIRTPAEMVVEAKARIVEIDVHTAAAAQDQGAVIVDVREPAEFEAGHIPGAINVPRGLLEFRINNIAPLKPLPAEQRLRHPIVVCCRSGGRSALAAATLQDMGYSDITSLAGGYVAWVAANQPTPAP